MLRVLLLTRGSPAAMTGGFAYQRRMAEEAHRNDASLEFAQASLWASAPVDADVVVVDSITAWRLAPAVLRRRRRRVPPLVALVHQPPGGIGTGAIGRLVQGRFDWLVYRRADAVIVAGRALAGELVRNHGVRGCRVVVVEPGCDLPPARRVADLRQGRRMAIVCVANWYPNKGVLDLLEAVAALPAGDVTVHLAGRDDVDQRHTAAIRARLERHDLAGRVVVHGTLDRQEVADLLAGADVCTLLSRQETYGTVLAEALAAGVPFVTWRGPHAERLATDGVEALLVPMGDRAALTKALGALAADERLRSRLAAGARQRGAALPRWADSATAFFDTLRRATVAPA